MEHRYLFTIGAFLLALLLTVIPGKRVISWLHKLKFGQHIREVGPRWHQKKQGTPTMGGILFICAIVIAVLVFSIPDMIAGDFRPLLVLLPALIFGGAGLVDDLTKIKKKQNEGLTPSQKIALQTAAAVVFLTLLRVSGMDSGVVTLPFTDLTITLNWYVYAVIAAVFIAFIDNAVNLTDGIDGLCAGVTVPVALLFCGLALIHQGSGFAAAPAAALCGGMLGFLVFNFNPARVFMGDTGSLFIGGMVCALAFATDAPLALLIGGLIYIIEAVSVVMQVIYFKCTHGKRIFKMTPIHHHFEMCGWKERKIFTVFVLFTLVMCAVAFAGWAF